MQLVDILLPLMSFHPYEKYFECCLRTFWLYIEIPTVSMHLLQRPDQIIINRTSKLRIHIKYLFLLHLLLTFYFKHRGNLIVFNANHFHQKQCFFQLTAFFLKRSQDKVERLFHIVSAGPQCCNSAFQVYIGTKFWGPSNLPTRSAEQSKVHYLVTLDFSLVMFLLPDL